MLDIDSKERLAHMDKEIHTSVLCIFFLVSLEMEQLHSYPKKMH